MNIEFVKGNILETECDAIVNPVNCVGVAGRGLALQMKLKYPRQYEAYRELCLKKKMRPGKVFFYKEREKYIISFPTKDHWMRGTRLVYIKDGIVDLFWKLPNFPNVSSIAFPALGCGEGGLPWHVVKNEMLDSLQCRSGLKIDVKIYEPRRK
ncbi:MAG: appr-1-p processing domain-containing protein [Bacteroidetes bacterium]|nr:MAG: appr-1-p processing domain-containing protein [Bacteroidota bacterium]